MPTREVGPSSVVGMRALNPGMCWFRSCGHCLGIQQGAHMRPSYGVQLCNQNHHRRIRASWRTLWKACMSNAATGRSTNRDLDDDRAGAGAASVLRKILLCRGMPSINEQKAFVCLLTRAGRES